MEARLEDANGSQQNIAPAEQEIYINRGPYLNDHRDAGIHHGRVEPDIHLNAANAPRVERQNTDNPDVERVSVQGKDEHQVEHVADIPNRNKANMLKRCGCCCAVLIFIVVTFLAVAAAGLSAYIMYSMYTENVVLREQLLQRNQMPLTDDDWTRVKEIMALEISRGLVDGLSPLRVFNYSLSNLGAEVNNMRQQQNLTAEKVNTLIKEGSKNLEELKSFVHGNLSDEIATNQVDIRALTETLSDTKRQIANELQHLSTQTQNNLHS